MEQLLTAEEFATLAHLEVNAVYRYARERKIPSIRIGSKLRFPVSALKRWIEDQLTDTSPTQPAETRVAA